ncbi:MAG: tetratricopeptide repeat protein, partial [Planctomycetes bacterium]|nr:tetratricopeptide repeat protein [Planctomycetota bacterium]
MRLASRHLAAALTALIAIGCTPVRHTAPPHLDHEDGAGEAVFQPLIVVPMPDLSEQPAAGRAMQSLQARSTPIGDVLLALFKDSDINLIVDPAVAAVECTFDIKQSTIEQAFEALLQSVDLGYSWDGDFLRVSDRVRDTLYVDLMNGSQTSMQSQGGTASTGSQAGQTDEVDFWAELEEMLPQVLGDNADAIINRTSATIHVEARPSGLARLRELVDTTLHRVNRQVSLEARILEVRLNDAYSLGVNWSLLPDLFNTNNTGTAAGGGIVSQTAASGGAALTFGVLDTGNFSAFVDALQRQGEVRVLSSPRVSTMNNQPANIAVTDQVPVIKREVIDNGGLARTEFGVEFVDTGVTLRVRPMIGEDGILTVAISPSVREQTGTVVTPDGLVEVPIVSERTATTLVRVSDGQAIALGGLRSTRKDETRQGVPFLMNLPLVGQLFSSTVQSRTEVELMILLSPRVLDDTWIQEAVRRGAHRLVQLRRGFQFNPIELEGFRSEDWSAGSLAGVSKTAVGPSTRVPEGLPARAAADAGLTVTRRGLSSHWLGRAQAALDAGAVREALAAIERALELDPRSTAALVTGGILCARQGDTPRARTLLDRALLLRGDDPLALTARGALELAHGSPHSARSYFARAHDIVGSAASAANVGAAMLALGDTEGAREFLSNSPTENAPPEYFANLAFAQLRADRIEL